MAAAGDELLCGIGSETTILGAQELREAVKLSLDKLGPKEKVLIIPPVRRLRGRQPPSLPSRYSASERLCLFRTSRGRTPRRVSSPSWCTSTMATRSRTFCQRLARTYAPLTPMRDTQLVSLTWSVSLRLDARCTVQDPMTISATDKMFEGVPHDLFRVHDWRNDVVTLGTVSAEFVAEITEGKYSHEYPVQVNKMVRDGGHDLVISIGQVVPHEVAGMANHTKNILVRPQLVGKLLRSCPLTCHHGCVMQGRNGRQRGHRSKSFRWRSVWHGEYHGPM